MNIRIKNYLQQMSKYISNKAAKQNAIIEIENHLLDQIDFYMEQGYSEDEATHMAIKEATDPKELGKKLNLAHRPFIYRYPFTLFMGATTCLSLIAVIIISHFSMEVLKENYIQGHISERVFEKLFIDWNGDYKLCCEDWKDHITLGNIKNENIKQYVEENTRLSSFRKMLIQGRRDLAPCSSCSYKTKCSESNFKEYSKLI